jgi:4-diphosphocytidyl-2-C-methyl-D-erythritol kinase
VSTPAAYAAFDANPTPPADSQALCNVLEKNGDDLAGLVAANLHNNLDPVACALLPKVAEIRAWLLSQEDVLGGQVTGSGSCVFALCRDDADAQRIAQAARDCFGAWAQAAHAV